MSPTLTGPMLQPAESWQPQDAIQYPEEVATELRVIGQVQADQ